VPEELLELKIVRLDRVYRVPIATARQWLAERRLAPDDLVRPVGAERWLKVSLAPELAANGQPAPAAPPAPTARPAAPPASPRPAAAASPSPSRPAAAPTATVAATAATPAAAAGDDDLGIPEPTNQPKRRRRRIIEDTELDMTPMIDVTFQLLIFFMFANQLANPSPIEVPLAKYGKGIMPDGKQAILVDDQGSYYLGEVAKEETAEPSLETLLNQVADNASSAEQPLEVIISAHKAAKHQQLRQLLERLSDVPNIGPIHLGVEEKQ
jgi:biopolymer transport protein ExbD